uniref:EF-hand domain-containing protein n=1 Tax=Haptolina ericina TaxID=156174 RepID=A0A7S3FJ78_9EUKA
MKLSEGKQQELNKQKRLMRATNERFFRAHPELGSMVSAFLTSLLTNKPDDIPAYASRFFTDPELAHKLGFEGWEGPDEPEPLEQEPPESFGEEEDFDDAPEEPVAATTGESVQDLEEILISLFKEADQDSSGKLSFDEFATLMQTAELGLSNSDVHLLLAEADENDDGEIAYEEFVSLAVEVVQMIRLRASVEENEAYDMDQLRAAAEYYTPPEDVLASTIREVAGEDGMLSRTALKQALSTPTLSLNKQIISMSVAAIMPSNSASASDVLPAAREAVLTSIAQVLAMQHGDEISARLDRLIQDTADKERTGAIDAPVLKSVMERAYGLTRLQVSALVNNAPLNENGQIMWEVHLPRMAMMVKAMTDPETILERLEMADRAQFTPLEVMGGREKAQMEDMLRTLFLEADADNNGVLDRAEFARCIESTHLGLDEWGDMTRP